MVLSQKGRKEERIMDVLEYVRKRGRMCKSIPYCSECPAHKKNCSVVNNVSQELIDIVEKWDREHPVETRQSWFMKLLPRVELDSRGIININPCTLDSSLKELCNGTRCDDCREKYWSKKVESNG